ncbi:cytochrome P450 [Mytilinidion resinicola]|uniref:Cytochrome P450 n=1 Tax=Mytilinidion resinicola TaxID=574789 RepID=A0A6A6Z5I3_9PEZI|nr:cytochrome P450 [Mytilinidion resinicola]KAF2815923.1 cytochrome P450 [Mytilinidion resinicola]
MSTFLVCSTLIGAYLGYLLVSLFRNYHAAKILGVPIVLSPFDLFHPLWYLISPAFKPLVSLLPYRFRRWSSLYTGDWPFYDKRRIHREAGDVFALVNPWNYHIIVGDPVAADAIYHRRKDFIKGKNYAIFNFFGRSVFSVDGEDWSRQRKITAPCFNERVSGMVWDESVRQARAVLKHWTSDEQGKVGSMVDDTRMITLHVLSAVGFGIRQDFGHGMADVKPGHTLAYRDALLGLLTHFVYPLVFPLWFLEIPGLPESSMKTAGTSLRELNSYMDEMLNDERTAIENGEAAPAKPNLMSALIRSSAEERKPKDRLTDEEIKGNLFIFNIAGHDTTANTFAYAISLLALHQDCQSWLREELELHVHHSESNYEEVFPHLKRCQAIMWETLRLYPPVLAAPRLSYGPQSIPLSNGQSISVPPDTRFHLNHYGIHISPSVWSSENAPAHEFHPQRWIKPSETDPKEETLLHPKSGTFLAWSGGPRHCLGQKFSQVEFVAVISTLLAKYVVELAVSRERLEATLAETGGGSPALTIGRKEDIVLRLRNVG